MYLFNTELPKNKHLFFALKSIYGLNNFTNIILKKLGLSINFKVINLSAKQISKLVLIINKSNIIINNELKKIRLSLFNKLVNLKTIKGLRLLKGLPVRGQRTHTNAKTSKKKLFLLL